MFNEPLLTSPSTLGPLKLHNKIFAMDHTDADNVKPTEKCHEVHNVDESDRLVGQLFSSRDKAWYFCKGFAREHGFSPPAFSKCMASWWTTEEFDIQWRLVVSEFNVEKHPWVIEKRNIRHLWAQAYLTGHFFANIHSTQRCESMNSSLAIALKHKKTYLDVVRAIEDGISRMCMNELKADYLSSHTKPFQITKLVDLESHAVEIFTRESFHTFQDELQRETLYRIQEEIQSLSDEFQHYMLTKTLIQNRWTKDVKASTPSFVDLNVPPEVMQMARFAALRSTSSSQPEQCSKQRSRPSTKTKQAKNKVEKKIRRCGYCNVMCKSYYSAGSLQHDRHDCKVDSRFGLHAEQKLPLLQEKPDCPEGTDSPQGVSIPREQIPPRGIDSPGTDSPLHGLAPRNNRLLGGNRFPLEGPNEYGRVSSCSSAKEIWDKLQVTHEGTDEVRESKKSLLNHSYENFKMKPDEDIKAMTDRFSVIVNGLKGYGEVIPNEKLVRKMIYSIPKEWQSKKTIIIEAINLKSLTLDELIGSLLTHEMMVKEDEEREEKKNKKKKKEVGIAFKSINESYKIQVMRWMETMMNKKKRWSSS
ncbi:Oxoglutarate/iron-dependent oxygenase [Hibiscus syriacus]|uniref:Oxoglutarate/iron-dependent oxygenase n=1 Tax=Hibiscus syriacus TaxID=106335 RepID=A0A6A2Z9L6_HIBSY|nr:Oxoglutarate/iron-dependent oxygenase [Hibiscus syriacus]